MILSSCSKEDDITIENQSLIESGESIDKNDQEFFFEDGIGYDNLSGIFGSSADLQINHKFNVSGEVYTGVVSNIGAISSQGELNSFLRKGMNSFIKDALTEAFENNVEYEAYIDSKKNYLISKVLVSDVSQKEMLTIENNLLKKKISFSKVAPKISKKSLAKSARTSETITVSITLENMNLPDKHWIPDYGMYVCLPSNTNPGKRFIAQFMRWKNPAFISNRTYEQDFILNNSDNSSLGAGVYLSDEEQFFKRPKPVYAATNLPAPYLDTRFQDASHLKTYTLGCADAEDILPNKWYTTFMLFEKGTADIDNAAITAQIGEGRSPTFGPSNSTYFIFAIETESIYPSWTIDIPGSGGWKKIIN